MKNPFTRKPSDVDLQIAALNEASAAMRDVADRVAIETSAPMLKRKLAELDPRLLDLLIDQSRYEVISGTTHLAGQRKSAYESCRYAYEYDVQIRNATTTWTDWGFGRRLEITAVDEAADVVWQECWKAARNRPIFRQSKIHNLSRDLLTDGEVFFVGTASQLDGATTWRTLATEQVISIIHPKNDNAINLWYVVQLTDRQVAFPDAFAWYALRDLFAANELPAGIANYNDTDAAQAVKTFAAIIPAQRNTGKDGRGWPEFIRALPWSNVYSQMLREYSAVFSAVAMYVDKIKAQGGSRTVDDIITALQSSLVSTSGAHTDSNPRPVAGSTWVENEAADRTRLPLGSAAGDAQTGTMTIATQLATSLGVKLSDVGRPDALQNRDTAAIAAESPQQRWRRYQVFWADVWNDVVEVTLRNAVTFGGARITSYESRLSTSLPMDIDTATIAEAMDAVNKASAAMTLDFSIANRANEALLEFMLNDLGVEDLQEIIDPPLQVMAAPAAEHLAESHSPLTVAHTCPLCGSPSAHSYEGHGGLLRCAECRKTYDPEVE